MTVEQRIRTCLLIEKMQKQKDLSRKLGLEDRSAFHGKRINRGEGSHTC